MPARASGTETEAIVLIVDAPVQAVDGGGVLPGLIDVIPGGGTSLALLAVVLVAGTLLTIGAALLIHRGRRGSRGLNR